MNSNTYVTPEEADAYYEQRTMETNLADVDGLRSSLEWPQIGDAGRRALDMIKWASSAIPQPVKDAQCEIALALIPTQSHQADAQSSDPLPHPPAREPQ
jgi:hypothetical protein